MQSQLAEEALPILVAEAEDDEVVGALSFLKTLSACET
jgi:hypothetical protein